MPLPSFLAHIKSRLTPACPVRAQLHKKIAWLTTGGLLTPLMASLVLPVLPPLASPYPSAQDAGDHYVLTLPLPALETTPPPAATQPASITSAPTWKTDTVQRKDTLGSVFERMGLDVRDAYTLTASSKRARQLMSQLKPGQTLRVLPNAQQQVQTLQLFSDKLNYSEFNRVGESYQLQAISLSPDILYAFAEAHIENSLFESANQAGIEDRLTMKLADVFGWDIDFALDIRSGDSFHVVYEELYLDGEKIGNGDIVAAEFRNRGQTYQALRYTDSNGERSYYTPEGESMRKTFLRTPIEFARISSHFNLKRKHPILHTLRAHKGTDYAASRGTPIRATGSGRITFAGSKGGYGRTVIIQHGQNYETRYGHLQSYARGIRNGFKVKQGQIIGYVGSSGLATGPHLHYEFHVNGVERNPVKVKFPKTDSISPEEKPRFLAQTHQHLQQLTSYLGRPTATQLALLE